MSNPYSLLGKTILITGASSGIGRSIAISCASFGATCVMVSRREDRLQATLELLEGEGHRMFACDLTEFAGLPELVSSFPNLDGMVHCAGISQRVMCKYVEEESFDNVININLKAPVLLQAEILRQKKLNRYASVIFVSSIAAESPSIGNSVYSASKGALLSYALCLKEELSPRMVRVNCISPSMVWTDLILTEGFSVDQLKLDEQHYPLKRYGQPEDIANLAVFLLSDASSWMTGSNIKITGGR